MVPKEEREAPELLGSGPRMLRAQESAIDALLRTDPRWNNKSSFVREAINEKLTREWDRLGFRPDVEDDQPQDVLDAVRRRR